MHNTSAVSPPSPQTTQTSSTLKMTLLLGNTRAGTTYTVCTVWRCTLFAYQQIMYSAMEKKCQKIREDEDNFRVFLCLCLYAEGWGADCLPMPVCIPPGGTNVSFEQFVDSPLSSWTALIQICSIFWTLGMAHMSCGHQCVIQMPWLHTHHLLLCSWI